MKKWRRRRWQAAEHAAAEPRQTPAPGGAASPSDAQVAPSKPRVSWRGIVLDLTVIATNLFLLAPLARLLRAGGQAFIAPGRVGGGSVSPTVGWLFLSVFAAHALGAYFKRLPKQARLAARRSAETTTARTPPHEARLSGVSAGAMRRRLRQLAPLSPPPRKLFVVLVCALLLFHFAIFLMLLFSGWQGTGLNEWVSIVGEGDHDE